jgi:hypothetical protein
MRRTLTLLLGFWVFTAPAVCSAICGDEPASADRFGPVVDHATTTKQPTDSCHRTSDDDRSEQRSKEHSAPLSGNDCCAAGSSDSFRIEAPNAPLNSFAHAIWAIASVTGRQSLAATAPHRTEIDCIQSPYFRANPPLLI